MKRIDKDSQFMKELFKNEKVPEYDAQASFERFKSKHALNETSDEDIYEESISKKDNNKFKWKFWAPAVLTALILVPTTFGITYATMNKTDRHLTSFEYFTMKLTERVDRFIETDRVTLVGGEKTISFVSSFYCEKGDSEKYFVLFFSFTKKDSKCELSIDSTKIVVSIDENYYYKKLDSLETFSFELTLNSGEPITSTFYTEQYSNYFND